LIPKLSVSTSSSNSLSSLLSSSSSSSSSSVTILGGTSTIGQSIVSLFCSKNYKVYASYRYKHKAQILLNSLSISKISNKPRLFEYHFDNNHSATYHNYGYGDSTVAMHDLIPPGFGSCSPYKHNILINTVGVCLHGTTLTTMIESLDINYIQPKKVVDSLIDIYLHDDRYKSNQLTIINISSGDGERCYLHSSIAQALDDINDLHSLDKYVNELIYNHGHHINSCVEYAYGDTPMYSLSKALLNKYTELKHLEVVTAMMTISSSVSLSNSSTSSSTSSSSSSSPSSLALLSTTAPSFRSNRIRIFSFCPGNIDSPMSTTEELLTIVPVEVAVHYLYEIAVDKTWGTDDDDSSSSVDSDSDIDHHHHKDYNSSSNQRRSYKDSKYQSGLFYRHDQLLNW